MAQESFEQLLNAVKQAESRGQRYDKDGNLLTSPKGAQGEMQVMPKTQRDPGYGVAPAKSDHPDELARVGKDYLQAMLNKYGDTKTALMAYNWGPGNTDTWLAKGADPKKVPAETQKYVSDITGMLGGKKTRVAEASDVQDLAKNAGPGYKAALAMMFLADDKPKTDEEDIWQEAQMPVEEPDTTPNAFADLDLGYQSPFPTQTASAKQQLAQFAQGGAVHRADGSPETGELTQAEIEAASRPAFVTPKSGLNRQQGPISQALNSGEAYPAIARGVAETPYNVVGAPVDLATLAMRPFGYKDEKPVMGSEWIKEKMTKMGIRPGEEANPTLQGFRTMGELGASAVNPAAPVRGAVAAAEKTGEAAKMLARDFQQYNRQLTVPGASYAVKPRGGTFATSGSITNEPLSDFDKLLDNYLDRSLKETPDTSHDAVREFIDKKARKYFTTEYGTGGDSLRTAMRTGEMPLSGADVERFPPYLLHAATNPDVPGHSMAKKDLERIYDKATNMDAKVLGLHNSADGDARTRFRELMDAQRERDRMLMSAEGVPNEFQNPEVRGYSLSELESYPSSTRSLKRLIEAGEEGKLPEGVKGALQRQQPIYDINEPYMSMFSPKNVAENIAVIPANKLKNMSFADAMIEGSKQMNVYRNYDAAVAKAERGGTIPKQVLEMFTKPFTKGKTGEWLQITDPRATALEGKLMNHSVGGYKEGSSYGAEYTGLPYGGKKAFDEGLVKVYSLRDDKGMPTVTLEMAKSDAGKGDKWNITQIRGRFNSEPAADQWDDIFKFIEKGEKHVGQIKQNSYNRNAAGESVPGSAVNWGSAYRDWKDGIDPTLGVQRSNNPPGWGQAEMAQGGAVERVHGDNRRYL